ncbi:MAG: class I SAM-dependent methyltransferase [Acidobacteria bacterium]|nr:class I SAM-dependent methyltransferase [Acidobacteriota bacterium]
MTDSANGLKRLINEFGIAPQSDAAVQLLSYLSLLEKWNTRINLTSTTDWTGIGPLFREAFLASSFYPDTSAAHLDIGSGAGFPAIPIRILKPKIRLEMVESRGKRSVFLETAIETLRLEGAYVHNLRLDAFLRDCDRDKSWDCISWKAIRLAGNDLEMLREHANMQTRLWMFHGRDPAVEDKAIFESIFKLVRRKKLHSGKEWFLSIYRPL